MIGQIISHYKIIEKLGEGGMGIVYKAHDTKLDRMVALKFLPQYLTSDAQEKERFYHEARATSALMHPNVTVIHEIHEHEGRLFLVMELIEGKTLKQLVQGDTLSIKNVLDIAIQCCEGLAAAHEKGIVHRDIKSDNIMMTPKGQVKIMDFGLAKMKGATKLTKTGSTLGTAAYMSPEQAQGMEVDPRSDIFSFGVVCYELLTTKLPFRGEHQAALMYSLINEEPPPIARFNEKVTPELERIVSKALAKDREDRYQHIDEMLADVRRERKQLEYARVGYASMPSAAYPTISSKKRTMWMVVTALALVGIVTVVVVLMPKDGVELNPDLKFRTLQIPFTQVGYPGFSPDGNWIAFPAADANGKWDLYFMNTSGGEPRRITFDSSSSILMVDISPDGSQIVYERHDGDFTKAEIAIVSSLGGKSKVLAVAAAGARWFPDGRRFGYIREGTSRRNEYWSIQPDGRDNRLEFLDSGGSAQGRISFSYSQQNLSIAFLRTFPEQGNQEIVVRDLTTGKERQITNDQKNIDEVCWAPNNRIIFSSNRGGNSNLWMVSASGGEAVQITKGSGPDLGIKISADTKKLLYYQRQDVGNIWIANIEHRQAHQITFEDRNILTPVFSLDATRIAFVMEDPDVMQLRSHIFVSDRDGGNRRQVTFGNERALVPMWSPHGKWIAYTSYQTKEIFDSAQVYLVDVSFHQEPKPVGKGYPIQWIDSTVFISMNMSSNGAWITYADGTPQKLFYVDSTGVGALSEKGFTMGDTRKGREGVWFVPENILNVFDKPDIITSIAVRNDKFPKEWSFSGRSQDGKQRMYLDEKSGELWNFILSSEKKEPVPTKFPGFNASAIVNGISYDGKEIIYVDQRVSGKLIMIENLFK